MNFPSVSVIIPAFNEAGYIPETLHRLTVAQKAFEADSSARVQVLVVDNASTDQTAECARGLGATVVREAEHNIAKVRNTGAAVAAHDVLVFLDADTLVPPELLLTIGRAMADPACAGGAVDAVHQPGGSLVRAYLRFWRILGLLGGMAQGSCQFCRKNVFRDLRGYDEALYMGEDVDFYWRLSRLARTRGLRTVFVRDPQVTPCPRRFDAWPVWRTLLWTNPLVVLALRRRRAVWSGWYSDPPR